ncbi:MAG: hypothetical protein KKD48_02755 [Nanoarchaeota archaeon]|nr:hypothetical protein [Nanoarchaeota archaeon]
MYKGILNYKERLFLSKCLELYNIKTEVRWKILFNLGLSRRDIQLISQKFRKEGLINKNNYNINKNKITEIKNILKVNKEKDINFHKIWDNFKVFTFFIGFILIIITLSMFAGNVMQSTLQFPTCVTMDTNFTHFNYNCTELVNKCYPGLNESDTQIAIDMCLENNRTYP